MTKRTLTLLCMTTLVLLHTGAHAKDFIPMPAQGGMTLGSGVNIMNPTSALPSCFTFTSQSIDPPDAARSYSVSVKAASSVREVNQIRNRGGSVGGSFGAVSASLQVMDNNQSSDKLGALYVVIEARYDGPRLEAVNLAPKKEYENLLAKGSPEAILRQCGTHVVMVEHRGQNIRVIIDLRNIDSSTKREISASFNAKGGFGPFSVHANGSYKAQVEQLAKDNKINVLIEGTGTPPSVADVVNLLKVKAGDLAAVGEALAQALAKNNAGASPNGYVGYGLSLQPLSYFSSAAPSAGSVEAASKDINTIMDLLDYVDAKRSLLRRKRNEGGITAVYRNKLDQQIEQLRVQSVQIRKEATRCLVGKSDNDGGCEVVADKWEQKLHGDMDISATITKNGSSLVLNTDLPMRSTGTLVAIADDIEIPLDAMVFSPGKQQTLLFQLPQPTAGAPEATPASTSTPPKTTPIISTSLPMTFSITGMMVMMKNAPAGVTTADKQVILGCSGSSVLSASGAPIGSILYNINPIDIPEDNICGTPLGSIPTFGKPTVRISHFPTQPVSLHLRLVDALGFQTDYVVTPDMLTVYSQLGNLFDVNGLSGGIKQ